MVAVGLNFQQEQATLANRPILEGGVYPHSRPTHDDTEREYLHLSVVDSLHKMEGCPTYAQQNRLDDCRATGEEDLLLPGSAGANPHRLGSPV